MQALFTSFIISFIEKKLLVSADLHLSAAGRMSSVDRVRVPVPRYFAIYFYAWLL